MSTAKIPIVDLAVLDVVSTITTAELGYRYVGLGMKRSDWIVVSGAGTLFVHAVQGHQTEIMENPEWHYASLGGAIAAGACWAFSKSSDPSAVFLATTAASLLAMKLA